MTGAQLSTAEAPPPEMSHHTAPDEVAVALSIIITVVGGESNLRRCLRLLAPQVEGRSIEIIVPYDYLVGDVALLEKEFQDVCFADTGAVRDSCDAVTNSEAHERYDARKAFGLNLARGEILALLDDTGAPDSEWCDRVLEAHRLPHGAIGGSVEYQGRDLLAWAVYLQDFGRYQQPLLEGVAACLTDINVSYKRNAIMAVHDVWRKRYSEMTVHRALARQGVTLWQRPHMVVHQDRGSLSLWQTLGERYHWGRLFGSVRACELPWFRRLFYVLIAPLLPLILVFRVARKALRSGRRGAFLLVLPYLLCTISAWCLGEFMGCLTGREAPA